MQRRIVAIIQARVGSTRLPGKVLADLGGATALSRVIHRTRRATLLDEVIVATSVSPADAAVAAECDHLKTCCFRGSEHDVLDRYYQAALDCAADVIVRITADCPLIDPVLIDDLLSAFLSSNCDYASNALPHRYPRGLGVEAFTSEALLRAWNNATQPYERVHVTPHFYQNPQNFRVLSVAAEADFSRHRWTLDTPEDLKLIRAIYSRFGNHDDFHWRDVLDLLEREPHLAEINSHVPQKALQEC